MIDLHQLMFQGHYSCLFVTSTTKMKPIIKTPFQVILRLTVRDTLCK